MADTAAIDRQIELMDDEELPVPDRELKDGKHFAGLYASEHVAATEFVFGATFVALGAGIWDILIGLIIGNTLAVLSFWLITTPIAMQARLSLYTYLRKIAGDSMSRLYNAANALIFAVIAAAMITVSATAIRKLVDIPAQTDPYPTHLGFILIAVGLSVFAVVIAMFGFNAVAKVAGICGPWLMLMFTVGGMVLLPAITETVTGATTLGGFNDFVRVAESTVFTGINADGEPGIGLWEVAGFAWAANTFAHFGLIDMALLRYAKKKRYGLNTATGMMFGHYVAWISAGLMGAATAAVAYTSITALDPGDVAYYALGGVGFIAIMIAGLTTAAPNLYRAGLAAQATLPGLTRVRVTLIMGAMVAIASAFPFVYQNMLPLLTYAGLILVPVGGIVFAEHHLFPRLGYTKFWARYKGVTHNVPAIATWGISLVFGFGVGALDLIPYYYMFVPTWALSIALYTVMAARAGAKESYPEEEERERVFQERVHVYQEKKAKTQPSDPGRDKSTTANLIRLGWAVPYLAILVFAWITLFNSPDMYTYLVNRERFYTVALWGSLLYFAMTYWGMQRHQNRMKAAMGSPGDADDDGDGDDPDSGPDDDLDAAKRREPADA